MIKEHPRIIREKKTIEAMICMYCNKHHETQGSLCVECNKLYEYAMMRLNLCPFQGKKSTCANCLVHCYKPQMREKIKKVMRYSGPRMLFYHPLLALHHIIDGQKKPEK